MNGRLRHVGIAHPALATLLVVAAIGGLAAAQAQEVGTVAALEGSAQIGRGGTFAPAAVGTAVHQGDELRTGRPGRLRVVFQDDSVLTVTDDSRVVVTQEVVNPEAGKAKSVMELLQGKVSALVSEYYHRPGSSYEIKTATAVAGVRGTEFVMRYNPREDLTEVVGLSGEVQVYSLSNLTGPGTLITANQITEIVRGKRPTVPRRAPDVYFRQAIEGLDFIGFGGASSLTTGHPLLTGNSVPQPDRAHVAGGGTVAAQQGTTLHDPRDASSIIKQPPSVFGGGGGTLRITF